MSLFLFSFSSLVEVDCDVFGWMLDVGWELFLDFLKALIKFWFQAAYSDLFLWKRLIKESTNTKSSLIRTSAMKSSSHNILQPTDNVLFPLNAKQWELKRFWTNSTSASAVHDTSFFMEVFYSRLLGCEWFGECLHVALVLLGVGIVVDGSFRIVLGSILGIRLNFVLVWLINYLRTIGFDVSIWSCTT